MLNESWTFCAEVRLGAAGDTVAAPPVVITRGSKIRPMEIRQQRPQVGGGRPSAPSSGGGSAASSKGGGK